jgi:uncharacterized protein (DUF362 family)
MSSQNSNFDVMSNSVGIIAMKGDISYPTEAPFNPPEQYPELPYFDTADPANTIYPMVRDLLLRLGMDREHFGSKEWNPFRDKIPRGGRVVLKPNWVLDTSQYDVHALITHMSVLRPLIDYAWKACGETGSIDILESPIQNTDWDNLMDVTQAIPTMEYLRSRGVNIRIQDIRTECFVEKEVCNIRGWRVKIFYRKRRPGTLRGYTIVDLGSASMFEEINEKTHKFRGIQAWTGKETRNAHQPGRHLYKIPKEILECDAFINVPKLKTHRKSGVTLTLKNLVGMADKKDWLPHYLEGTPEEGGDEAPSKREFHVRVIDRFAIFHFFKKFGFSLRPPGIEQQWRKRIEEDLFRLRNVRQANWYGGNTVWRMVYDLNTILMHADVSGKIHKRIQRYSFGLLDGIISGEKFGPLNSIPKPTGVIIGGEDPVRVEFIGTRAMGFHERCIRTLTNLHKAPFQFGTTNPMSTTIVSNEERWPRLLTHPKGTSFTFIPPPGWQGHIEYTKSDFNNETESSVAD